MTELSAPTGHRGGHPGIDTGKRFAQMRGAFDDAMITGREEPEPGTSSPR
jgi:hypothetical protein